MDASTVTRAVASATCRASLGQPKHRTVMPQGLQVVTEPAPERVRQVRRIIAANMERWAFPPPLAEDVQLVVSELLTNAVIHSGADEVTLTLRFIDGFLRIDVRDGVLKPEPRLRSPSPDAENGRGLFLVQTIAGYRQGAWGVSEDGTTTWCELAVT